MNRSGLRCAKCGYSLRGLRTLTCPECGDEVTLARLERMEASRLDRRERVWMGVWGACIRGRRGGWVDELSEILRGGS